MSENENRNDPEKNADATTPAPAPKAPASKAPATKAPRRRTTKRKTTSRTAAPKTPAEPVKKPSVAQVRTPSPPKLPGRSKHRRGSPRDLDAADYYLNRELTWLNFNFRVLREAEDERNPLLERVKFLSIVNSNLDEFFMKRIGGLKQQVGAGMHDLTVDGRTPQQQIKHCYEMIFHLEKKARKLYRELVPLLREAGVCIAEYTELSLDDQASLRQYYVENIFPLVTPQAMDPAHPFPFVSNLSLNLLVTLHHPKDPQELLARVKVPVGAGIKRLLRVGNDDCFVRLEDVMAHNLDLLFPGMEIEACELFRVTRNANTEIDEETADDLLAMIETELRERQFAAIVRMEVAIGMNPVHRGMLAAELDLDEFSDVFEIDGMLGMRDLMELMAINKIDLKDTPHHPINNPELRARQSIFHTIRRGGPVLLMHPYESFSTSVERFLREASQDPKVRAIKMTLYRTSEDTRVIEHLIDAARNGKQVAVVVELKARFDEQANIKWAARLEAVGIHVTYGVVGLKTHSKVVLVVRRDYNGLRRYAHVGTGNYHAGTARIYSDLGLLTCDDQIGQDLTEMFNYLTTGYKPKRDYFKILPAPKNLKQALLDKIQREIDLHSAETPGLIQLKTNALEDVDLTRKLYEASLAGVHVDLIIRDTCRLIPGIPELSENICVISIVGRFLEHTRIFYFRNNGSEEYFIGSADIMKRNLESRVECVVPVEGEALQAKLRFFLNAQLADQRNAWEMQGDGSYIQRNGASDAKGCHQLLIEDAEQRHKEASRLRKRKPKGISRRQTKS